MITVSAKGLARHLRSFGTLPKLYTIHVEYESDTGKIYTRTFHHSVIRLTDGVQEVAVADTPLKKLVAKSPESLLCVKIDERGMELQYGPGAMFLKHAGEFPDIPVVDLREVVA